MTGAGSPSPDRRRSVDRIASWALLTLAVLVAAVLSVLWLLAWTMEANLCSVPPCDSGGIATATVLTLTVMAAVLIGGFRFTTTRLNQGATAWPWAGATFLLTFAVPLVGPAIAFA